MTDLSTLMVSIKQGSESALAELIKLTKGRLMHTTRRITDEFAEDACTHAYMLAWEGKYDASKGVPVYQWLHVMARRRAISYSREGKVRENSVPLDHSDFPAPDVDTDPYTALYRAMAQLPETERRALIGHYWVGFTHSEYALRESLHIGTVKGYIHRGKQKLRDLL